MMHIEKNTNNTVFFTGTEHCLLTNPFFLFVFKKRDTDAEVRTIATNISTYNYRYDKVVINGAIFSTFDEGLYQYDIYEQAASTGTDIAGKNKIESGFMYLK